MPSKIPKTILEKKKLHHLTLAHADVRLSNFKRGTRVLRYQAAALSLAVVVGVTFLSGFLYAFLKTNPALHASVAGKSAIGSSWQVTVDDLESANKTKEVTLVTDDGEVKTTLANVGASIDMDATKKLIEDGELQRKIYPWKLLKSTDYSPIINIDADRLNKLLTGQNLIKQAASDAQLVIKDGEFTVVPGADGWQVDVKALSDALSAVVLSESKTDRIVIPVKYSAPQITTAAAERAKKLADDLMSKPATATYDDQTFTLAHSEQQKWVNITSRPNDGIISVSYDQSVVSAAVDSFSDGVNIAKHDQVVYHFVDNTQVTSVKGQNGRSVVNKEEITQAWMGNQPASVIFANESFAVTDAGLMTKLIVVDLNTLRATAYDAGVAVNSFPISGGKPSTPTPLGTFAIYAKTRVMTMTGPGYSTPNIEWISWFYPDYALHGAYWHNDFGRANVSHGCVNFRNVDAQWVYNWAPVGTPVIVQQS